MDRVSKSRRYYTTVEKYHDLAEASHADQMFDKSLIAPFMNNGLVLDVGAGTGFSSELFEISPDRYIAFDFSQIGLSQVIRKERGSAVVGDAALLSFRDCRFDSVLCSWALEHFENPHGVLDEMLRVVKIGGRIIIWGPNWDNIFRKDFPQFSHKGNAYLWKIRLLIFLRMIRNEFLPFHYHPYVNTDVAAFAKPDSNISGDTDAVHCVLCQETVKFFARRSARVLCISDFSQMTKHLYNDPLVRVARRAIRPLLPVLRRVPLLRWFVLRFPLVLERTA